MLGKFNADLAPGDPAEDYIVVDFFYYIYCHCIAWFSFGWESAGWLPAHS